MKLIGFPRRYLNAPECTGKLWWDYYKQARFCLKEGGIVVAYGAHGTGKTRMSYELAKNAEVPASTYKRGGIEVDHPRIYTTAVNLFMDIRSSYNSDEGPTEREIISGLTNAAFLVIDEIQERGETAFEDRKLTQIIDARYMDGRPTMLISNFDRKRFAETLSPAVLDRIREGGIGLHFNWGSYRKPDLTEVTF
jgi:DNA replication protein DnaC